jgi:hypothetical protein
MGGGDDLLPAVASALGVPGVIELLMQGGAIAGGLGGGVALDSCRRLRPNTIRWKTNLVST